MIDWIKFKGSTQEDRIKEVPQGDAFIIRDPKAESGLNIYEVFLDDEDKVICPATFDTFDLMQYDCWAHLNLPEEEEYEREYYFMLEGESIAPKSDAIALEFDNIYSILNEMRNR